MAVRHLRFPIPNRSNGRSLKRRSARSSPASPASSLALAREWERQHQRVRRILRMRPDVGQPIVAAFARVLDVISATFQGEF